MHVVGKPRLKGGLSSNSSRESVSHVPGTYESFFFQQGTLVKGMNDGFFAMVRVVSSLYIYILSQMMICVFFSYFFNHIYPN